MKTNSIHKAFYFFLAIVGATAVPLFSQAQQAQEAADDADGPRVVVVSDSDVQAPAQPAAGTGQDQSANAPQRPAEPARNGQNAQNHAENTYFFGGGAMGGGTSQYYYVSPQMGFHGNGSRITVATPLGVGQDTFAARLSIMNGRANAFYPRNITFAPTLNGSAQIGTSGNGSANAALAAALVFPVLNTGCVISAGPAAGASVRGNVSANVDGAAAGPGAYLGGWCERGQFGVSTGNHVIVNAMHFAPGSTNDVVVSGQSQVGAWYHFNRNVALGATAQVDYEARSASPANVDFRAGLELNGVLPLGPTRENARPRPEQSARRGAAARNAL